MNLERSRGFLSQKIVFESSILAHFEDLKCVFPKYNDFFGVILAKNLTTFDPSRQKLNNLTDAKQ